MVLHAADAQQGRSQAVSLDATLAALADGTRRGVVDLLRKSPRRASDLADALGASKPAMSRHLRVLRDSGLVETSSKDDGRERIYTLRPAPFAQLRAWIEDIEAFWTVQLASFKDHVERTRGKR
ncbi:MAG: winged helix-turn-helix transcriptional regulator [Deltaproteobacteria bacterium]|nr:MAG: winged helix-turn-helix transcriptional regulator [Deltaproteobacteria bacterium]TMQ09085.1 MAG: winged helix-turn-helix transcriptional regulator [Deltaproteobacteria bacterium]